MRCPACRNPESKVVDSRPTEEGTVIRRRRECMGCGRRFTTYEQLEDARPVVVKKDGRREAFDRGKILAGLMKACEKRPVSVGTLERLVEELEAELKSGWEQEVGTAEIGEKVMEKLRVVDEVAYVRFASVYRQFADINRFREELEKLLNRR